MPRILNVHGDNDTWLLDNKWYYALKADGDARDLLRKVFGEEVKWLLFTDSEILRGAARSMRDVEMGFWGRVKRTLGMIWRR